MSSDDIKSEAAAAEVVWHDGHVRPEDRYRLLGQRPVTVWFTSLSASGKSTLPSKIPLRRAALAWPVSKTPYFQPESAIHE